MKNEFLVSIDQPTDWDRPIRYLRLAGWCVGKNGKPLTAIRARIRAKTFPGTFNIERPDVAENLGDPNTPLRCGFTVEVQVPPGNGELELEVARADGKWLKVFSHHVHGPWFLGRQEQEREIDLANATTRYEFHFDQPTDWNQPGSPIYISGWCVERNGSWIDGVRARIGRHIFPGNFEIERKDVATLHPNLAPALRSGFAIAVIPPSGKATIVLEAKDTKGTWRPFYSHAVQGLSPGAVPQELPLEQSTLFVPRTKAPGFEVWFDHPLDWDKIVSRDLRIAGWCMSTRGESIIEMRARVGTKVFPVKYGIARPDIALAFEGNPAALATGFVANLDAPRGSAMFVLETRTGDSDWRTLFDRRIRGPVLSRSHQGREEVGDYAGWIREYDTLTQSDRRKIAQHISQLKRRPLFSILLPVHNTPERWLRRALHSVRDQLYPHWELCIVDDASADQRPAKLIQHYARRDSRIRFVRRSGRGHICAASNESLAMATGEFVALLDHDDELAPTALYFAALELNQGPGLQLIYTDEDKLDRHGLRCQPHFKSDWNPDLFTAQNYISHLGIYAANLVREVGGFRIGFEGAQDYDLALRCIEKIEPQAIAHIPRVLYHWRITNESTAATASVKPYAMEAASRAVQEHFSRSGVAAKVESHREIYQRVRYPLPKKPPAVSMIIATRNRVELLRQLVESVFEKTDYPHYELIILDNESTEKATLNFLSELRNDSRVRIQVVPGSFNYSKLNNIGVSLAKGEIVALMNNDLEVINRDWLAEMVSHAIRPEVGAVGARLWYPDGTLQHGGVILGSGGVAGHIHGKKRGDAGYFSREHLTQNFSAVTAACMVVRKDVYRQVNGLDEENLPVAFGDVDFCLRLRQAGFEIVWTPHAELVHHESASRGVEDTVDKQRRFFAEEGYMKKKWGTTLAGDPYYNPNLSLDSDLFKLAFPPRVDKPWTAQ